MRTASPTRPRIFVDADVLFAGAASPSEHGAGLLVLRIAEITLVEALTSEQVIAEAERNLEEKLPGALPTFRLIVSRCLRVVPNPSSAELEPYRGLADPKDLPILVATLREACPWLVTFNARHSQPGHHSVDVLRPGELLLRLRDRLARLADEGKA